MRGPSRGVYSLQQTPGCGRNDKRAWVRVAQVYDLRILRAEAAGKAGQRLRYFGGIGGPGPQGVSWVCDLRG